MPPVGFESTISAGERPQTYALDRGATGTGGASIKVRFCRMQNNDVASMQISLGFGLLQIVN